MREITLSWLEYNLVWQHLGLGPQPAVLATDGCGDPAGVWASLAAQELGEPGNLHHDLEDGLRLLADPTWAIDGRLHLGAGPRTSTLIAAITNRAVLAVLNPGTLTLHKLAPTELARSAVMQLPGHPPGIGISITLPADALDGAVAAAGEDKVRLQRELVANGLNRSDARRTADVLGSVTRYGQFGVSRRAGQGHRRRASSVVTWYDTPAARYLFTRRATGGEPWATLAPGTDAALTQQITELLDELSREPGR